MAAFIVVSVDTVINKTYGRNNNIIFIPFKSFIYIINIQLFVLGCQIWSEKPTYQEVWKSMEF